MTHKLYGVFVRCTWKDMYEWGRGWLSKEKSDKFSEYWLGSRPKYYRFRATPREQDCDCISLNSVSWAGWHANIYLHPQGFHTWITGTDYNEVHAAVTHLKILCDEAAEACGGTCIFETREPTCELTVQEGTI